MILSVVEQSSVLHLIALRPGLQNCVFTCLLAKVSALAMREVLLLHLRPFLTSK